MLRLENVSVAYGGFRAVDGVTFHVEPHEFISLVGPNGAGKSTLFRAISGVVPVENGKIIFDGVDITKMPAPQRARLGISHVPEGRQLFTSMSVYENLEMGRIAKGEWSSFRRALDRVYSLFPVLAERRGQPAGTLSGGQQQMVAIGRGMISEPRLLMLDEPSMGLSPLLGETIFEVIGRVHRDDHVSIVLVEQRVAEAIDLAARSYVLDLGRIVSERGKDELLTRDQIQKTYFGITKTETHMEDAQ